MFYSPTAKGFFDADLHAGNIPSDAVEIDQTRYRTLLEAEATGTKVIQMGADGLPEAVDRPGPTTEERVKHLLAVVDAHLNAAAQAKGYDNIITAALRAGFPGPYHAQGVAYATWMDATYNRCYELLDEFKKGDIEEPSAEALIAMLPVLELPAS